MMRKGGLHISENESMLVSERRPEESNISKPKPPPPHKDKDCSCSTKLERLETKLEMFGLRLEEIAANLNISFTKHMDAYGKIVEEQKKRENIEYLIWEIKETNEAVVQKVRKDL